MAEVKEKTKQTKIKKNKGNGKAGLPTDLPIIPLKNTVLFPHQIIPLSVGRKKTLRLINEAWEKNMTIGVVAQRDGNIEDPRPDDIYRYGTSATILRVFELPDGSKSVIVQGLVKFKIEKIQSTQPFLSAQVKEVPNDQGKADTMEVNALASNIKTLFQKTAELTPYLSGEHVSMILHLQDPGRTADMAISNLKISTEEKQEILEIANVKKRLERVNVVLNKVFQTLELGNKIQTEVQDEISKTQREYYLREQLKAIQKELGEFDGQSAEIADLQQKIDDAKMPEEVLKVANKELDRLAKMSPMMAEYTVSRTYIEWLTDLPWNRYTEDNLDLKSVSKALDNDHYGLEKVKKRILEYLAVRKLKPDMKGPILCFVGPPGVGKTSLGRSIANAIGRKFVRISLGGIRDEAEIRGHRRTYIGALPGRMIQGIKKVSFSNPVFMLDEIDKVGSDFRGDPSSALLEVLDPEQNHSFSDHYLEVNYNLSKVLFIATANVGYTILPALRDRMEIIEIPGYTENEKIQIAKRFTIPKQLAEHGLSDKHVKFEVEAIKEIIISYTREAGLRNLEREIATIIRGVAKLVADGKRGQKIIRKKDIRRFLGNEKFFTESQYRINKPGIATGLAWTPAGGDILFIEATKMPGKGALKLTGQLGDVMKESAEAALSYIRSKKDELKIRESFDKTDLHIHVPAGSTPKDGPSAGITIFTALVSLLTGRQVSPDIAMTGEITLRGSVLPIGGVKEKVLAAHRAGVKTIILPKRNRNDLVEIPKEIRKDIQFKFVGEISQVIRSALLKA